MAILNGHQIDLSLHEFLTPDPSLVDGRSELDWLHFISRYASLINFFNEKGNREGDWSPFVLKDPVFLTAAISKTRYASLLQSFRTQCLELLKMTEHEVEIEDLNAAEKFFNHLDSIYRMAAHWTFYMQQSGEKYQLRHFVLHNVQSTIAVDFWAIHEFREFIRQQLAHHIDPKSIHRPELSSFHQVVWKENKNKKPYWAVLGFPLAERSPKDMLLLCHHVFSTAGGRLFGFIEATVQQAPDAFEQLGKRKSKYPDTTLLRSFVKLLALYQNQLNNISQRHLEFYYESILKQSLKPAVGPSVFLTAVTASQEKAVILPAGTRFNAGTDVNKRPVYFASKEDVTLNPASVSSVYTVSRPKNKAMNRVLSVTNISAPDEVQKESDGRIKAWPTFGTSAAASPAQTLGVALASPLLLLNEGTRTIWITLSFDAAITVSTMQNAAYFLSTEQQWLAVDATWMDFQQKDPQTIQLAISLKPDQPSISPFKVNPDGFASQWPMLKILLAEFPDTAPPNLLCVDFKVQVFDMVGLQLYNDYGALSVKNPFAPFGQTPSTESNFIVGNAEIFSKPFYSLSVFFNWDKLPPDFSQYYSSYNEYLNEILKPKKPSLFCRLFPWWCKIFHTSTTDAVSYFSNTSFSVTFEILAESAWQPLAMDKMTGTSPPDDLKPYRPDSACVPQAANLNALLFDTTSEGAVKCITTNYSQFAYSNTSARTWSADPDLQLTPLKFTDKSSSGFVKMSLDQPQYGFGYEIYPAVVAYIGLLNAGILAQNSKSVNFNALPNQPFVPKLKLMKASYAARQHHDVRQKNPYPLECFTYTPFSNYKVYDSEIGLYPIANTPIVGDATALKGIPLYQAFDFQGALLVGLTGALTGFPLTLYFEMNGVSKTGTNDGNLKYFYLTETGWRDLTLSADTTNGLNCSGIIAFEVPDDIATQTVFMPGSNSWIAIAVNDVPANWPQTVILRPNGFQAAQVVDEPSWDVGLSPLPAGTITKTASAFPQVLTFSQPFPSFGGAPAERPAAMYRRVSNTIKTKQRAASANDFYRLICGQFDTIFYTKVYFDAASGVTWIYLVKTISQYTEPDAFLPVVSQCTQAHILQFLQDRVSPLMQLTVCNFNPQYVGVFVRFKPSPGCSPQALADKVERALNIYLSPWILSSAPQASIDQPITSAHLAAFISGIDGIAQVTEVLLSSQPTGQKPLYTLDVVAPGPTALIASSMVHDVKPITDTK